jgi:hemoglobin
MELAISTFEFGKRPEVVLPNPDFFNLLKEDGMRKMVSEHYDLLRQSNVKGLFPPDDEHFELAKKHSADFFIQICGGPSYFNENRGKPLLVKRHETFAITPEARLTWLQCYKAVLLKLNIPEDIIVSFWNYINYFSNWMVNTSH